MESQGKPCTYCKREKKSELKYILPCYCTLCKECCDQTSIDYIKKKDPDKCRCNEHNIPFPESLYIEMKRDKIEKNEIENIKELMIKSKFYIKLLL